MKTKTLVVVAMLAMALVTLALAKATVQWHSPSHDGQRAQQHGLDPNPTIRVLLHQDRGDEDLW
jgi:hypothetical protein